MALTDDNFASIVKAIQEGRGIYANIRKYLIYPSSLNAGELLTMSRCHAGWACSAGLGRRRPVPALLAAQLLWIDLVTDGLLALALGVDPRELPMS